VTAAPVESVAELTTVGTDEAVVHDGATVRRLTGLRPDTDHEIDGFAFRTLPEPGAHLATFAAVNDVHFGETVCGLVEGHPEVGPVFSVADGAPPYPEVMNRSAVAEIGTLDPPLVVVKGDLTAEGTMAEYEAFCRVYAGAFGDRLLHVRGNHESFHSLAVADEPVQVTDLPGAKLVLLDTSVEGLAGGGVRPEQLEQLDDIAATSDRPVLLFGHHHVWDPGSAERPEHYFGIFPDDSERLVDLVARRPAVIGYFAGHTHRNRVRRFEATGGVPWVEVACVKDYPGMWAEYRIHERGVLQIVHRISTPEALDWTEQTRHMFHGLYATYAFGTLADRCFVIEHRAGTPA
jgi:predicted phosphodiesterase